MLTFRSPRQEDAELILDVMIACDLVDVGHPDSDLEDVRWRWRNPRFSLRNDAILAEQDSEAVAYACLFEGLAEVFVIPSHRGQGIGGVIETALFRRAKDVGTKDGVVKQNMNSRNEAGLRLLRSRGYEETHHYARMEIELREEVSVPPPPPGVSIRTMVPDRDERSIYDAYVRTWSQYAPHWEAETYEDWLDIRSGDDFDPDLWFLAERAGELVGFNVCLSYPEMGWVQFLGTIPEERGRGLGELLLKQAFAAYQQRGVPRVGLTVNSRNVPEAKRLYERCGMSEVFRYIALAKPLS